MNGDFERQRLLDLLADRALEGLSDDEERELQALLERCRVEDAEIYDAIVAELTVAELRGPEEVPPELQQRLEDAAQRYFEADDHAPVVPVPSLPSTAAEPTFSVGWSELAAWFVAAICVVIMVARLTITPDAGPEVLTAADRRAALVAGADDLVRVKWTAGPTAPEMPAESGFGDVVWSPSRQEGYMRFRGLSKNDPSQSQYQLWIFDETRNTAHPVDGGVFDITEEGESIVPIIAKLDVREATLFAITVEKPGGVVVSDRSRLPLLAKVEG